MVLVGIVLVAWVAWPRQWTLCPLGLAIFNELILFCSAANVHCKATQMETFASCSSGNLVDEKRATAHAA
jgi:hypothetical protein